VVEGRATGEAKPRFTGWMDLRAARLLRAWFRLNAKRREAIADVVEWIGGGRGMEKRAGVALRLDFRKAQIIHPIHQPITSLTFQAGLFHPDNFLGPVPSHETTVHYDIHALHLVELTWIQTNIAFIDLSLAITIDRLYTSLAYPPLSSSTTDPSRFPRPS
jgi:hypothetical protein